MELTCVNDQFINLTVMSFVLDPKWDLWNIAQTFFETKVAVDATL
jgi:hypothetical protein